jgi:heat shock protein HslJ
VTARVLAAMLLVAAASGDAPLEKTYWKATQVGEIRVQHIEHVREPHVVFNAGRLSGADGCNRITAGYELRGDRIHVSVFAATRMACEDTQRIERAFTAALTNATQWRVERGVLELYDAKHARLARFEAQPST